MSARADNPGRPSEHASSLRACIATFQEWLYLPDPGALLVTLATVASNRAEGDPVWLLNVGAPGSGKTELLKPLERLPGMYPTATLTEAALLSGVAMKDKAPNAKGGLLREIGDSGIIVLKDFGSILSMNRDARGAVLAALREVYDGSWTRRIGTDGGRTLSWSGKVGLIAGCPPTIDGHHAVTGSMGERFIFYRLPPVDGDQQVRRALGHIGRETEMREELRRAARHLLEAVATDELTRRPHEETTERLVGLAALAVRCRSAVERDLRSREINLISQPESPARLALVLLRLLNALRAIGTDVTTAWALVTKCALDSMPALRLTVLHDLIDHSAATVPQIAERAGYPHTTICRALEELAAHGVASRKSGGKADLWVASSWTREHWPTVPEMSERRDSDQETAAQTDPASLPLRGDDDFSGTIPTGAGVGATMAATRPVSTETTENAPSTSWLGT